MAVRLKATNMIDADAIEKVIRVMPKSLVHHISESRIFSKLSYSNETFIFPLNVNKYADEGSIKTSFIIEPNLLSEVMDNLENLIDVPTGSGESNMINFVPNVAVLDYLTTTAPNHPIIKKAEKLLKIGYQNQLKYRLADGSYKDFEGSNSSIFLTAFVAKSMQTASKYLTEVDGKMVNQAFDWLASKQHDSGRFEEIGPIVLQDLQSSKDSIALTSYVLIAFLENVNTRQNHSKVIESGTKYILQHIDHVEDSYVLAIATYALSLHNSNSTKLKTLKTKLVGKAILNQQEMYWNRTSQSIETTAYALLTIMEDTKVFHNGILAMRWLANQRYKTGGFPRTQDTFIGLKALTKLADVISPLKNDYSVDLKIPRKNIQDMTKHFKIYKDTINTQIYNDIPQDVKQITAVIGGQGMALITVRCEYSLELKSHRKGFNLTMEKLPTNSAFELKMRICTNFIPQLSTERSNMALVEVTFPSGYVVDNNPISNAAGITKIQNIEIRFGATSVVVYYPNMGTERNCFDVTATRRFKVSFRRPAHIIVQDYYNPKLNAIEVYNTDNDE